MNATNPSIKKKKEPTIQWTKFGRTLVMDDAQPIRKLIAQTLRQLGLSDIDEMKDGMDGWVKLEDAARLGEPYGLVFCDDEMPTLSGIEILKKVRAHPLLKPTVVVLICTEPKPELIQAALAAGVDQLIVKPFSLETLREKLGAIHLKKFGPPT